MKVKIKNLGAIKQAEFTLGELTVVCGCNNTGKTYAAYALFGFLYLWRRFFSIDLSTNEIDQLFAEGAIHLDINAYVKQSKEITEKACQAYTQHLSKIFAASPEKFKETEFFVVLDEKDIRLKDVFEQRMSAASTEIFSITKSENSTDLVVTLLVGKEKVKIPREIIGEIVSDSLKEIIFSQSFPNPFIASAERTGAAIFRGELNFARNRLLEEMSQADKSIDPRELLFKDYQDYALPIKTDVDFIRRLESLVKENSFIALDYPSVLTDFADIIGGHYTVNRNDELYYVPKDNRRVKLSMDESSSAVRSLLGIGFYLRHEAKRGDLLIVDEPELNLHPENQRRIARLFARLIDLGVMVFITTHSDYIIKELNTLIMLNQDKSHLNLIAEREGYRTEELLPWEKVKVYVAEKASVLLEGKSRKIKCQTLTQADIDPDLGIEIRSFDEAIETMNRIQEEIIWGAD